MKDLSMHVMDILQNSTRAGAHNIELYINENYTDNFLTIRFTDDGCGMTQETLNKVTNPFYTTRTTRKVGLGIPLLKQNAELCGGYLNIKSEVGKGTVLECAFELENIDRPPLGDIGGAFLLTAGAYLNIHFIYKHYCHDKEFIFDTDEVNEALEGVPINDNQIFKYLKEMILENLKEIGSEVVVNVIL